MSLRKLFPYVKYPIFSGPMANVAGAELAVAVSRAGGLGLIGGGYSTDKLRKDLFEAIDTIGDQSTQIGFGVLTFAIKDQSIIHSLLRDVKPSKKVNCIWLFGGDEDKWIPSLRSEFPEVSVMVQVHTVQAAKQMVASGAQVIIAQGSDAGGHGGAECSSIVALVPEVIKACPGLPVLAAGGISDGQAIFAAMSLGAAGVVLGTRFMVSKESLLAPQAKKIACETSDGGRTTVQTRIYDTVRGTDEWPMKYTGRAIRNKTVQESLSGRQEADLKQDYSTAVTAGDYSRVVCWAGTGVGLIDTILPAGEIVTNLVEEYNIAVRDAPKTW